MRVALFALALWCVDLGCYQLSYRYFDKINHIGAIEQPQRVWLIGTSHVFWGIEPNMLRVASAGSLGVLSVPGANTELRRALVEETLRRHDQAVRLIIIEADVYAYAPERYPHEAWRSLIGYYHRGVLRDFLAERFAELPYCGWFHRLLRSYTLSNDFAFIGMRYWKLLFGDLARTLHALSGRPPTTLLDYGAAPPPGESLPGVGAVPAALPRDQDPRREEWRRQYAAHVGRIDERAVEQLRQAIATALQNQNVEVVLLETPNANFFPERAAELDRVRAATRALTTTSDRVHYLRLDPAKYEDDFSLYLDASHLGPRGRAQYTEDLIRELQRRGLLAPANANAGP